MKEEQERNKKVDHYLVLLKNDAIDILVCKTDIQNIFKSLEQEVTKLKERIEELESLLKIERSRDGFDKPF